MRCTAADLMPPLSLPFFVDSAFDTSAIVDTWRQLHHAAQAVVEVGKSWGETAPDDSHSALVFDEAGFRFESPGVGGAGGLSLSTGLVSVTGDEPQEECVTEADGRTVDELRSWVRAHAERMFGPSKQAASPAPDLPEHAVGSGAALQIADEPAAVIASWYSTTQLLLERFAAMAEGLVEGGAHELTPRLWPHHFDLASLAVMGRDGEGAMTRTVGFGLAVPDEVDASGYWYVSGWRRDASDDDVSLPALPHGRWERASGSPMAVLPVREVCDVGEKAGEASVEAGACAVASFAAAAINASSEVLAR